MLFSHFIMPTQTGSVTFDGTILIGIAVLFVVVYLYKNKDKLKTGGNNLQSNKETDTISENHNIEKDAVNDTAGQLNKDSDVEEEEYIKQQEKIKLQN